MASTAHVIGYGDLLARSSFFEHIGLIAFVLVALIAADRRVSSSRSLAPNP